MSSNNDSSKGSDHTKASNTASSQLSSGFISALKLSSSSAKSPTGPGGLPPPAPKEGPHQPAHRALKAKSSSLRLGSVLSSSTSQMQKTRSVQFNTADLKMKLPGSSSPKRQKLATTARLTSFKSFGRPHAGDFGAEGGPKNATFGNFGGSQGFWGRDGKLASKPRPMLPSETTDMLTSQTRRNANATFDVQKPPIHLTRASDLGINVTRKKKPPFGAGVRTQQANERFGHVPESIPRTATALEGWYIKKLGGNR